MRRRLFNSAALLSTILCLGTVWLWKQGRVECSLAYQSETTYWYLVCSNGRFVCGIVPATGLPRGLSIASNDGGVSGIVTSIVYPNGHVSRWQSYDIPCVTVAAATALIPILWMVSVVSKLRHHSRRGYCDTCDYNLTGNTSGICPECGTPMPLAIG